MSNFSVLTLVWSRLYSLSLASRILLLAGLIGICSFFMPFIHFLNIRLFGLNIVDLSISGWRTILLLLNRIGLGSFGKGKKIWQLLTGMWESAENIVDYISALGFLFILMGPFFVLAFSLSYVYRSLKGKSYKRGLVFILIYTAFSWIAFVLTSREYHIKLNFFHQAGLGYWAGTTSILLAYTSKYISQLFQEKT